MATSASIEWELTHLIRLSFCQGMHSPQQHMQLISPVQLAYTAEITRYTILYFLRPLELQKGRGTPKTKQSSSQIICIAASGIKGLIILEARACFSVHKWHL